MTRKILLVLSLLLISLVIGIYGLSIFASSKADQLLRNYLKRSYTYSESDFEKIRINLVTSTFTIQGLKLNNSESQTILNSSNITIGLPLSLIPKIINNPRGNALNSINSATLKLSDVALYQTLSSSKIEAGNIEIRLNGKLSDALRLAFQNETPLEGLDMEILLEKINVKSTVFVESSDNNINKNLIDTIRGRWNFNPITQKISFIGFEFINYLQFSTLGGEIQFITSDSNSKQQEMNFEFLLSSRLNSPILVNDSSGMGINYKTLDAKLTGSLESNLTIERLLDKNNFILSIQAEELQIIPPHSFSQGIGRGISMLGITSDMFVIPKLNATYRLTNNMLIVDETKLETPYAVLNLIGKARLDRNNVFLSPWVNSGIFIEPTSPENARFISTITGMLGLRLERREESLFLPIRGTLISPTVMP